MAAPTPKPWVVTSYTPGEWTNLIAETAVITSLVAANNSVEDAVFALRHGSAIIIPATTLEAGTPYAIDLRSLVATAAVPLQFMCDTAGLHLSASGASYAS